MPITSVTRLLDLLREHALLEAAQLQEVEQQLQIAIPEPRDLAKELIRRGWLTPFQVERLALGQGRDLTLGPYLILEELGQGSMGLVYKARHQKLGHIVALKVVRKDHKSNPKVLSRFRREIRAITRLSHPNMVTACDIDEVDRAGFFAMEFVEGVNLHDVLRQIGPLPLAPALDYVRQAAVGLQHAYEQGLIHRDIKPANLLITPTTIALTPSTRLGRWGVVKILDLGLALLQRRDDRPKESNTHLTGEGLMLGTVDYVAPEQVMSPHEVDIRADLYSLGCSLYEMLTGKVPFPDGSPAKKLYCHQEAEPLPVDQYRPGLPNEVTVIIRKLMAKSPAERFQTPAHLASTLATVLGTLDSRDIDWEWQLPSADGLVRPMPLSEITRIAQKRQRDWVPLVVGVALLVLLGMLVGAWMVFGRAT